MVEINLEKRINIAEDYKPGDTLMMINGDLLDEKTIYYVDCIMLDNKEKRYMLISIEKNHYFSAEESFKSLEEMIAYYRKNNTRFAKVDIEMNVKLRA